MLSRPQDFLNMRDYQRKLIKACLKDCNVIRLLAGIMPWSKRVHVVLLTGAYLLLLFSLQWPSFTIWSFISLTLWSFRSMVSFLSAQSWCKYLLTNVTGNLLSKYWLKIKTSFGFFLPPLRMLLHLKSAYTG